MISGITDYGNLQSGIALANVNDSIGCARCYLFQHATM